MKIISSRLEGIAAIPSQYLDESLPEVAFAGRSNVGKSSFINSVINRRNLARTSGKPGKTRTINFYNINESFRLVDLPGYGYASVSKTERESWGTIIEQYLTLRENLREVMLLVDIRHEPSAQDCQMYEWILSYGFTGFVIATKADKISKNKQQQAFKTIMKKLKIVDRDLILLYSSTAKTNLDHIHQQLENIVTYEGSTE